MNKDLAATLKWWVQHANELEKELDLWKKVATAYHMANDNDSLRHANELFEMVSRDE